MTPRRPVPPAPGPLETYCQQFDALFSKANQRDGFRRYLAGLLLPQERNKTLTALANTEPVVGAQQPPAQSLQWFLSESTWDPEALTQRRLELLGADPLTAPSAQGVLVIDEHGDRKWGRKTAHVGRQYLANLGKTDNGVVSVSTLWADEGVYYPLHYEPYTPAPHFARGQADPRFRTKRQIAAALVRRALAAQIPCRAVVADSFYGEDEPLRQELGALGLGYVLALQPSHCWWHLEGTIGSLEEAVAAAPWAGTEQAAHSALAAADAAEIVRLYGLRQWVEQSYKQTKYALGWHEYQVRSDRAIRRHWALVCCAFAFCWYHLSPPHPALAPVAREAVSSPAPAEPSSPPPRPPQGRPGGHCWESRKVN